MTVIEKRFSLVLTEQEIDYLTTALHGEYKCVRNRIQTEYKGSAIPSPEYDRLNTVKDLRNSFGNLVGRRFMGEDA